MIEYRWTTPLNVAELHGHTLAEIEAAARRALDDAIGDFRQALGLSRTATPEEIAAENYCHECGRPYDEEDE